MTPAILTNTNRFGEALVEFPAHWAVVMNEQDAQLVDPSGNLAATFTDPTFCHAVADLLNAVVDAPLPVAFNSERAAIEDAADVHELLAAANEVVERQNAELAAWRVRHTKMIGYLNLLVAVALDGRRESVRDAASDGTSANHGSSVEQVSVPASANCDPGESAFPPAGSPAIDANDGEVPA